MTPYAAFLSHASQDASIANQLEQSLRERSLTCWVDNSSLAFGGLLRQELQAAIQQSRTLILLWSEAASQSRWVMAEIFTAFHLHRFIIPYVLDATPLPQFLANSAYLSLKRDHSDIGEKMAHAIAAAPDTANKPAPMISSRTQIVESLVNGIGAAQINVVQAMTANFQAAKDANIQVEKALQSLMKMAPMDAMVLNLAGFQCKNDYMFQHWDAIQAGRAPKDPMLQKAERYFFDTLCIDPFDPSALNGLGSILMFERELDAAEFFQRRAIDLVAASGGSYEAAKQDLELILYFKQKQNTQA
ncbi:MAG TPA: TIR domain-containing protein [Alloacidobacterium sp.]|nr:TIR domain-containing protein [Alloacidobacterium sp.]